MIVIRDTDLLKGKRLVATIGFFDGVHLGHRFLINELKEVAKTKGLPSAVITLSLIHIYKYLRQLFKFNGIPRYVMLDRDGNVVDDNFPGHNAEYEIQK